MTNHRLKSISRKYNSKKNKSKNHKFCVKQQGSTKKKGNKWLFASVEQYIDDLYTDIANWEKNYNEATKIIMPDTTISLTKTHFLYLLLASSIEVVHEFIFKHYTDFIFLEMEQQGISPSYCLYEKTKLLKIINNVHSWKWEVFLNLSEETYSIKDKIKQEIKNIKESDNWKRLINYQSEINNIFTVRDKIVHNSKNLLSDWRSLITLGDTINTLKTGQKILTRIVYTILSKK